MTSAIALLDSISCLSICIAFAYSVKDVHSAKAFKGGLLVFLAVLFSYVFFLLLEWADVTHGLEAFEDYMGAVLPLWWLMVFWGLVREAADKEIKESEQRLKYALEATHDGVWDWRLADRTVQYSPHWFSMLGYESDDLPHTFETWKQLIRPEDKERVEAALSGHLMKGEPFECEVRMKTKSGGTCWVLTRGKVVERDRMGRVLRIVGTHVDINKRKEAERKLIEAREAARENAEHYKSMFDSSPTAVIEQDMGAAKTKFMVLKEQGISDLPHYFGEQPEELASCMDMVHLNAANPAALRLFDAADREALAAGFKNTMTEHGWTVFADIAVQLVGGKQSFARETTVKSLKGEERRVLVYVDVVTGFEESLNKVLVTFIDVTEKKKFEEIMVHTEKMLSVGGIAAGMAHEINNPLGIILQAAQGVERRLSPAVSGNIKQAEKSGIDLDSLVDYLEKRNIFEYLNGIKEAGRRASSIVVNMLNFSRKSESQFAPRSIEEILDKTVELASGDYNLKKKYDIRKVRFIKEFGSGTRPVPVTETEIEQVFFNIIGNAAQAMSESGIPGEELQSIVLRTMYDEREVRIEIEDNGPGMDDDILERIFEPFYTTKKPGVGTGLGLSVSRFIISRNHGGTISVESKRGMGTKFIITLPLARYNGLDPIAEKN